MQIRRWVYLILKIPIMERSWAVFFKKQCKPLKRKGNDAADEHGRSLYAVIDLLIVCLVEV